MQKKQLPKFNICSCQYHINKVGREGMYLNIIKAIYNKPTTNIILKGEILKAVPLRSATSQACPLSPLLFNIVLKSPSQSNKAETKMKRYPN